MGALSSCLSCRFTSPVPQVSGLVWLLTNGFSSLTLGSVAPRGDNLSPSREKLPASKVKT